MSRLPHSRWEDYDLAAAQDHAARNTSTAPTSAGCLEWLFKGQRADGTRRTNFRNIEYPVHKFVFFAVHNPQMPMQHGMSVVQTCGNKACVSKAHLKLVLAAKRGAPKFIPELDDAGMQAVKATTEHTARRSLADWSKMSDEEKWKEMGF